MLGRCVGAPDGIDPSPDTDVGRALGDAAVVVEDRYSQVFKLDWVRPAVVADGLAELQICTCNQNLRSSRTTL
jgi:hypothetical protein